MAPLPRLSIIIPCAAGEDFENTLVSVLQHRPPRCQVIVASPRPYADPYQLAGEVEFVACPGASERTELVNGGLAVAVAPVVHWLSCRTTVTEGWEQPALAALHGPQTAAVSPLLLDRARPERVAAWGVTYSALLGSRTLVGAGATASQALAQPSAVTGPTLDAAFFRRDVMERLGGAPQAVGDELADLDLALLLEDLGWKCRVAPQSRVLCDLSQSPGPAPSPYQRARNLQRLFRRHAALHPSTLSGVVRPMAAVLDAAAQLPGLAAFAALAGRIAGRLEAGIEADYEAELRAAQAALEGHDEAAEATLPFSQPPQASSAAPRRRAA